MEVNIFDFRKTLVPNPKKFIRDVFNIIAKEVKMQQVTIVLKHNILPIYPKDFFFDAYGCVRYFTDYETTYKDDKYIISRTVHIIPLSSISEITIQNEQIEAGYIKTL